MHIRFATSRRNGKVYKYPQLVESYRRTDGMPATRVVLGLSGWSELEVSNLRQSLAASRQGVEVTVVGATRRGELPEVQANLRYLDVAAVLRTWMELGMPALLAQTLAPSDSRVSHADVLAALVVHRCVAPGSKLSATHWYPTTALPLLLGVQDGTFNNTRVHRALTALDGAEAALQHCLPGHLCSERDGAFVALFLDITDTWFEGRGAPMAQKGKDKQGIYRRRIGVALMCDARGYPVRWKTLPGRYREAPVMEEMCQQLAVEPWARGVPVVMDRGMGRAGSIEFLVDSGLHFLTALPVDEFASYTERIPSVDPGHLPEDPAAAHAHLEAWALQAGFTKVRPDRFVLDLGVIEKGDGDVRKGRRHRNDEAVSQTVASMRWAKALGEEREKGASSASMATRHGTSKAKVRALLRLLELDAGLQVRVMAGELNAATYAELTHLSALSPSKQVPAFDLLRSRCEGMASRKAHPRHQAVAPPIRLRAVLHFNPERFLEQCRVVAEQRAEVFAAVEAVNACLKRPRARRRARTIQRDLEAMLAQKKLMDVISIKVDINEAGFVTQVRAVVDEHAWIERRRHDGINVLAAAPALLQDASALVSLYFAKDAVEKDFQTIKSEVELRPVRHRTDPKVRAHVALCVLAVLVERAMEHRMRRSGISSTAPAALDILATCHLNQFATAKAAAYLVTRLSDPQRAVLRALDMENLENLSLGATHPSA